MKYVILMNRQGKVRLSKWFLPYTYKDKQRANKEIAGVITGRRSRLCNVLELKGISRGINLN